MFNSEPRDEGANEAKDLVALLKSSFQYIGNASMKIDRGQFLFTDWDTGQIFDTNSDCFSCLLPGRRLHMFMVLWTIQRPVLCPKCKKLCQTFIKDEIYW